MHSSKDTMVILGSRRGPLPVKAIGKIMLCLLRDVASAPVCPPFGCHPPLPSPQNAHMIGARHACLPRP